MSEKYVTAATHVMAAENLLADWDRNDSDKSRMLWTLRSIAESLIALNKRQEETAARAHASGAWSFL